MMKSMRAFNPVGRDFLLNLKKIAREGQGRWCIGLLMMELAKVHGGWL